MMTLLSLVLSIGANALVTPPSCNDQQIAKWVHAILRPNVARATETMTAVGLPLFGSNLRLAFERHLQHCDENAHGAERQALTKQLSDLNDQTAQELKLLSENRPRALEKCAGPTSEACAADVTEAFRLRERAIRTSAEGRRQDLERQRRALRYDFAEARRTVDGYDVMDAFAKAFGAKLAQREGAALRAVTVQTGQEFTSSWQVVMDIRFQDHNFEYLTRVYANLYKHISAQTIAQVQSIASAHVATEPARITTVNSGTLEDALADRRAGREFAWLVAGRADKDQTDKDQVGVLDTVTIKTLKPGLRP